MALTKVRGRWKEQGFGSQSDIDGPIPESDSASLTKAERAKLSAFLNRYPQEREIRLWGLNPTSSRKRGAD